jgi:hypothetical protein
VIVTVDEFVNSPIRMSGSRSNLKIFSVRFAAAVDGRNRSTKARKDLIEQSYCETPVRVNHLEPTPHEYSSLWHCTAALELQI